MKNTDNMKVRDRSWMQAPWTCPLCSKTMKLGGKAPHAMRCGDDLEARFWSYVRKGDGCWLWIGAGHRDGYGRANVRLNGKTQIRIAHRVAWQFTYGPIPEGMDVCHTCDVRLCCNPEHLYLGTHQENMADMLAKGRKPRGETSNTNKLTEAQVLEILRNPPRRGRRERGGSEVKEYALRYGVKQGAIYAILRGKAWKHLQSHDIYVCPKE